MKTDEEYKRLIADIGIKDAMNSESVRRTVFKGLDDGFPNIIDNLTLDSIVNERTRQAQHKQVYREIYAFILRHYKGYTYQQVSDEIGVTRERCRQIIISLEKRLRHPQLGRKVYKIK